MGEPKRNFIQDQVLTSARVDPVMGNNLYDIITNTTTASVLRTQCELGDFFSPTDNTLGRYDTINDFGRTYDLYLDALLSTSASPGNLTIAVQAISGGSPGTVATLQTVTITPDASLTNAPLQIRGLAISEFQGPKSVTGLIGFSGTGIYQGASGVLKMFSLIDAGTGQSGWGSLSAPSTSYHIKLRVVVTWASASTSNIFQCREMAWLER